MKKSIAQAAQAEEIIRSFAFINYNIPPKSDNKRFDCNYITLGFFDGMKTKLITDDEVKSVRQKNGEGCALMGAMWRYNQDLALRLDGTHSFQNVFGVRIGTRAEEQQFWENNTALPLTFVTLLQMKPQEKEENGKQQVCKTLLEQKRQLITFIEELIAARKKDYPLEATRYLCYTTLDKNDFIVGFRTNSHRGVSNLLVKLHEKYKDQKSAGLLYTYSILSLEKRLLNSIRDPEKDEWLTPLQGEFIDSISFKGVINTEDGSIPIEAKAKAFTQALDAALFQDSTLDKDSRLYDIIGECDYRYIARKVPLVNLLKAMAPPYKGDDLEHPLNYQSELLRATMFSTRMILNQQEQWDLHGVEASQKAILQNFRQRSSKIDERTLQCDALERNMEWSWKCQGFQLEEIVSQYQDEYEDINYVTNLVAMWKLLTSLRALERAPARKYEFKSLYEPYQLLHEALFGSSMEERTPESLEQLKRNWAQLRNLSVMIQNFSTTLHSTMRNDLQFFQINDFNAIAHYAPAKLRAFYAAWVSWLVKDYRKFQKESEEKKYAFLVVPDNGPQANTEELKRKDLMPVCFIHAGKACNYRIMCINLPERLLYTPEITCVILAHEVAHFGGGQAKKRDGKGPDGTSRGKWGEDRLSAYIRSLSIWYTLVINSMLLHFLSEEAYDEKTQGFSDMTKQAFLLYLGRTMAEHSFLSTHLEERFITYWKYFTAQGPMSQQESTGIACIEMAKMMLHQFVEKSQNGMNLSDHDYLLLDMETDFNAYLDENWNDPAWRKKCSDRMKRQNIPVELWNEELKEVVIQIMHAAVHQQQECSSRLTVFSTDRKDMAIQELIMLLLRESHADLISILELRLTPEQYVHAQRKSALVGEKKAIDQYTRMSVVAETMAKLAVEQKNDTYWQAWLQWEDQLQRTAAQDADAQAFLQDWKQKMRCVVYDSYLEPARGADRKSFGMLNTYEEIDTLMDWARVVVYCSKNIQDTAVGYLAACGRTVLEQTEDKLANLYQAICSENLEQIAELIDSFLQEYEQPQASAAEQ